MYNSREAWHTSSAMVPGTFNCSCWAGRGYSRMLPSASSMMRAIMLTASIGYFPVAVSAESITASDPSKIALATSEASARVGRGFSVIDSSIWEIGEHTSELQSHHDLVCRLLLEKKKNKKL